MRKRNSKSRNKTRARGFSLTEILIYVTILAVAGTFLTGIFINSLKVQNQQTASQEVEQQLNFVLENIQRYVQSSSQVDIATSTPTTTLTLRMQDTGLDPTLIYLSDNKVFLKQGSGGAVAITSDKIIANNLSFTKIATSRGHDTVQVDLMLSYTAPSGGSSFSKSLSSAIARVNAATFDSNLIPGADNSYDVGLTSPRWRNANLSGNLIVGGNVGIGTVNPTSKLSILKGASSSGITTGQTLTISDEDYVYYYLEDNNAASGSRVRRIGNEAGKYTNVRMNDAGSSVIATDFVIDNGGNVGIGVTTPNYKLQISDGGIISSKDGSNIAASGPYVGVTNSAETRKWIWQLNGTTNGLSLFNYSGDVAWNAPITITQGGSGVAGNVGIGTTNPLALLEVKSASGSGATFNLNHPGTADYGSIYWQENGVSKAYIQHYGSTRGGDRNNNLEIGTLSTNAIQFRPNDTAAMTIINGGNVGIGTASPGKKLTIALSNAGDGITMNQSDSVCVTNAWTTIYTLADYEHGLYFFTGSNYGGSALLFLHANQPGYTSYMSVIAQGGDISGYTWSFRLAGTDNRQVQAHHDYGWCINPKIVKMGGING